jgi:hypothetical protein
MTEQLVDLMYRHAPCVAPPTSSPRAPLPMPFFGGLLRPVESDVAAIEDVLRQMDTAERAGLPADDD